MLDELTYPIKYGFLAEEEILKSIARRPAHMHVVITGRNASERVVAAADLVTQMCSRKHPFEQGVPAQAGIEF